MFLFFILCWNLHTRQAAAETKERLNLDLEYLFWCVEMNLETINQL